MPRASDPPRRDKGASSGAAPAPAAVCAAAPQPADLAWQPPQVEAVEADADAMRASALESMPRPAVLRADDDVLLLHDAYEHRCAPDVQNRIHARIGPPSLVDRLYFATRDLARRGRGTLHSVLPDVALMNAAFALHGAGAGLRVARRRR